MQTNLNYLNHFNFSCQSKIGYNCKIANIENFVIDISKAFVAFEINERGFNLIFDTPFL